MTKRRGTVTGWDPAFVNPNGSTGRPKGVQTAIDARIAMTYDVLGAGVFAKYGVPVITGSPTNSASISAFQCAIPSPNGGFYIVTIDAAEAFTITMANVGAVKIYIQQEDYEVDNTKVNSAVNIGVVYGATAIPANSLLLFTTTITNQTSTSGLTFTPAFKYTGAASGAVRVPLQADLANITLIQNGTRALILGGAGAGEWVYNSGTSTWIAVSPTNNLQAAYPIGSIYMNATSNVNPNTLFGFGTWVAFAAGRMLVGVDSTQTEFTPAGKTGGQKDMQLHTHANRWRAFFPSGTGSLALNDRGGDAIMISDAAANGGNGEDVGGNPTAGLSAGSGVNNMNPYIVVYMWQRTA